MTVFKPESDMIHLRYICPFMVSGSEVEKVAEGQSGRRP